MLLGIDEVVLFFLGVAVFLAVIELGYRFGLRHSAEDDAALKSHTSVLQSALLGLLALLLGFTFAMAVSRFDLRRTLVLEESFDELSGRIRAGPGFIAAKIADDPPCCTK